MTPIRMVAVLVLYRCKLSESAAWQSLRPQVDHLDGRRSLQLLVCENEVFENQSDRASVDGLPAWVNVRNRADNGGLAWAYNAGLALAQQIGAEWLLTLDQDTRLPADFLDRMMNRCQRLADREEIAAIVPQLVSAAGTVYSPVIARLGLERAVARGFTGVVKHAARGSVRAFNSAATVRVRALAAIGGYPELFWLSFLDHATFRSLGHAGGKVWIAGDIQVEHHLSLAEGRERMPEAHFVNFLQAEAGLIDLHGSRLEGLLYTLRLFARQRNQIRRGDPAFFSLHTRALLLLRLRLSKQQRLAQWMDGLKRR